MDIKQVLFSLSEASCITGAGPALQIAFDEAKKYAPDVYRDRLGNVIAPVRASKPGEPHVLLEAHIDEIGFVVTNIDKDGFLHVAKVGGPDIRILLGHEVTVFAKKQLFGVFSAAVRLTFRPMKIIKKFRSSKKLPSTSVFRTTAPAKLLPPAII